MACIWCTPGSCHDNSCDILGIVPVERIRVVRDVGRGSPAYRCIPRRRRTLGNLKGRGSHMWLDRKSGTERSTACHWDILAGICGCLCKGLSDTILCNLVCMSTLRSTYRGSSCRWADCILEGTAIRTGCSPCSGDASPCSGDTRHSLCSRPTSCVGTLARTHSLGACAARSSTLLRGDRSGPCGGHCWVPRDDRSAPSSSDLERHLWCSRISQLAAT